MDLRLEKVGIDPKAFCFQKSTIERAKQLKTLEDKSVIEKIKLYLNIKKQMQNKTRDTLKCI